MNTEPTAPLPVVVRVRTTRVVRLVTTPTADTSVHCSPACRLASCWCAHTNAFSRSCCRRSHSASVSQREPSPSSIIVSQCANALMMASRRALVKRILLIPLSFLVVVSVRRLLRQEVPYQKPTRMSSDSCHTPLAGGTPSPLSNTCSTNTCSPLGT